jgi:hypothetical protein
MNDTLYYEQIPTNLRTANIGGYNTRIYICPECSKDIYGQTDEHCVGFGVLPGAVAGRNVVQVILCPGCGQRYYFHAWLSTYTGWLSTRERLGIRHQPGAGDEIRKPAPAMEG